MVCLDDPQHLLARVHQRVAEGGHDVPAQRILERYPRTLAHLQAAVRRADLALLYDSQVVETGTHRLVALCQGAQTQLQVAQLPQWAAQMLGSEASDNGS